MKTSKDAFEEIMTCIVEFKQLSKAWFDKNDVGSAAKARRYAKKIMNSSKDFVSSSIIEAKNLSVKAEPEEVVFTIVEEETESEIREM